MATAGELHPTEGFRLVLERESVTGDRASATYRATIYTPTNEHIFSAVLETGGAATLTFTGTDRADAEHEKRLLNLVKSMARAAERNVADGLPPWPERINRWRGPGRQ